jgi:hypothetical protein
MNNLRYYTHDLVYVYLHISACILFMVCLPLFYVDVKIYLNVANIILSISFVCYFALVPAIKNKDLPEEDNSSVIA